MTGAPFVPVHFIQAIADEQKQQLKTMMEVMDVFDPKWRERPMLTAAEEWADLDLIQDRDDPSWDDLAARIGVPLRWVEPGEPVMNVDLGIQLYWPGEPPSTPSKSSEPPSTPLTEIGGRADLVPEWSRTKYNG